MSSKKACLLNCENLDRKLPLFKFPSVELDFDRRKKWFDIVGLEDGKSLPKIVYLCGQHFSNKQFTGNFLLKNAVPDINLQNSEKSYIPVAQSNADEGDDEYRTIRVDKELYERIMNSLITPGSLVNNSTPVRNKTPPPQMPKHTSSKNIQTGKDSIFPCAMVEYDFDKKGYCLQCFFCVDKFYIHEWDLFEMHMLYQHDGFRQNFFKSYTKMQKVLTRLKEKYSSGVYPCGEDKIMTPTPGIKAKPLSRLSVESDINTAFDPLDITDQNLSSDSEDEDINTPETAENNTLNNQDDSTKYIFKKSADNKSITPTESVKSDSHSSNEQINKELNYLFDESDIDDLEFLEETNEPPAMLSNITSILNASDRTKHKNIALDKNAFQQPNSIALNNIKKCRVLLKREDLEELAKNYANKKNFEIKNIRRIDISKLSELNINQYQTGTIRINNGQLTITKIVSEPCPTKNLSKPAAIPSSVNVGPPVTSQKVFNKGQTSVQLSKIIVEPAKQNQQEALNTSATNVTTGIPKKNENLKRKKQTKSAALNTKQTKNKKTISKAAEDLECSDLRVNDNAESGFDTVEMLIDEEQLNENRNGTVFFPNEEPVEIFDDMPYKIVSNYGFVYKPYDPYSNDNYNVAQNTNVVETTNTFKRNLKITSNDDELCCSDACSSEDDDECNPSADSAKLTNEIRFKTTPPNIVFHFIELLRTNTVLWFERSRSVEKYDIAVSNIIMELSVTHNLNMTSLDVRRSVNRIKSWFHRMVKKMSDTRNVCRITLPYSPKYDAYFQKCFEFLPTEQNYEKWHTSQGTETRFRAKHLSVLPINECEFCKMLFESKNHYVSHMSMMHKKCKQCYMHCENDKMLAEHLASHQNTKAKPNYVCEICNKGFYLKNVLRQHSSRVHGTEGRPNVYLKDGKRVYPCRLCGEEFDMPYIRKWHELKHEGPQFKCNNCDKRYYTKFNLRQHQKFHKNQRDHMCDICGKSYFSRKNLIGHQDVVHFRKNSIVCDICGIDISNPTNLERHKRVAHADKREGDFVEYTCKRNGQSFVCRRKKREGPYPHVRRKWRCKLCGETFPKYKPLLIHKREAHSVNKSVPCPLCKKVMGETFLKRHIKQVHTSVTIEEVELETLEQQEAENFLVNNMQINYNFDEEFQLVDKTKIVSYEDDADIVVDDVEKSNVE